MSAITWSVTRVLGSLMRKFQQNKEAYFELIKERGDSGQDQQLSRENIFSSYTLNTRIRVVPSPIAMECAGAGLEI